MFLGFSNNRSDKPEVKIRTTENCQMPFVLFSKSALRIHFSMLRCALFTKQWVKYIFFHQDFEIEMILWIQEAEHVTFVHSFGPYGTVFVLFCFLQQTTCMQCFKYSTHYSVVYWHSPLQAQSAVHFKAALTHEQLPRHPFLQPHLTSLLLLAATSEVLSRVDPNRLNKTTIPSLVDKEAVD